MQPSAVQAAAPYDLRAAAHQAMLDNGFAPDLPPDAARQTALLGAAPESAPAADARDLRQLLWSSIDNDDTRDLDQVEVAEALPGGDTRLLIGVADVDALVSRDSPIDRHAAVNTTSVYTGVVTYNMLPERLSTDLTSLKEGVDRATIVIELIVSADGVIRHADAYRALIHNRAKLAYGSVGAWLEGNGAAPTRVAATAGLEAQLRLQDTVAQALRANRTRRGALDLDTIEASPVVRDGQVVDIELTRKSRARELIEDFMIAANVAMATSLEAKGSPSIRRVVRTPARWPRIVELAATVGETLPATPDSGALAAFLIRRRAADPDHFPDLSLSVVKLLGAGDYVLERPGEASPGHFALAVEDYTHSTAPNRRFADLVTQRLLKAALAGAPPPYTDVELTAIADHCTDRENAARKVERLMRKKAAAVLLVGRIGETFDAIVTGASPKGTYVRILSPPVEGRVVRGWQGLDVGDRARVTLVRTDPADGFIDFERVDHQA